MNKFDYRAALTNLLKSVLITRCGADPSVDLKVLETRFSSFLQIDDGSGRVFILDLKFFTDAEDDELVSLLYDFIDYFKGEFDHEQK